MSFYIEQIRHSRLIATLCVLVTVYLASGSCLFAQETVADLKPAASDDQPVEPEADQVTGATADQASSQELDNVVAATVRTMFQEKKSPLLHIRWGTRVYLDAPLGDEPEGADLTLRKAELKLSKKLSRNLRIKLSGTYNKGTLYAGDSYLVYSGWKSTILSAGVQTPPFSLQSTSASSAYSFMEPALPVAALAENRNAGVNFLKRLPNHILSAGWTFYNPRQEGVTEVGRALVARYVFSPIKLHGHENLHLGGSLSYRFLDSSATVRYRSRPEVATSDAYYVDTDSIYDGKTVVRAGLEANQIKGRFSWQSELLASRLERHGADKLKFWGGYVQLSQFLTNDSRNYDRGSGTYVNVRPNAPVGGNGRGAFELTFRASYIDLSDKDVIGGKQRNLSLGLNWYPTEKYRLMANLIKVLDVDRPGSEYDGLDPIIFALRGQWLIY